VRGVLHLLAHALEVPVDHGLQELADRLFGPGGIREQPGHGQGEGQHQQHRRAEGEQTAPGEAGTRGGGLGLSRPGRGGRGLRPVLPAQGQGAARCRSRPAQCHAAPRAVLAGRRYSAPLPAFSRARSAKLTPIAARVRAMIIVSAMMNASCQAVPATVREKMMPGIIAVPIAAPVRWPSCRMPPATPPNRGSTEFRVRVWFGEMVMPWLSPMRVSGSDSHQKGTTPFSTKPETSAVPARPTKATPKPTITMRRPKVST